MVCRVVWKLKAILMSQPTTWNVANELYTVNRKVFQLRETIFPSRFSKGVSNSRETRALSPFTRFFYLHFKKTEEEIFLHFHMFDNLLIIIMTVFQIFADFNRKLMIWIKEFPGNAH